MSDQSNNGENASIDQAQTATGSQSPAPTLSRNGVILAIAALIIMSGFSAWVVSHYQTDSATNAATILGIVIPAFATIGAAAFAVTVAYKSGTEQGKAAGQAQGKSDAAKAVAPHVKQAQEAIAALKHQLEESAFSAPGSRDIVLGIEPLDTSNLPGDSVRVAAKPTPIDVQPLETATASLAQARGALDSLTRS
jgi:hypothetical protein